MNIPRIKQLRNYIADQHPSRCDMCGWRTCFAGLAYQMMDVDKDESIDEPIDVWAKKWLEVDSKFLVDEYPSIDKPTPSYWKDWMLNRLDTAIKKGK